MDYADRGKLGIVYGDVTLGVHGEDFHLIFSYQTGGLESMVKQGMAVSHTEADILESNHRQ